MDNNPVGAMRAFVIAMLLTCSLAIALSGCEAIEAPRKAEEARRQQVIERAEIGRIWVTNSTPKKSKPYNVLGDLSYTEPFSPDAIDTTNIERKLRRMGYEKWPDNIDAIINEHFKVSADGTQVAVSAQAIQYQSSSDRAHLKEDLLNPDTPESY